MTYLYLGYKIFRKRELGGFKPSLRQSTCNVEGSGFRIQQIF